MAAPINSVPAAWAFGTFEQRRDMGGLPGMILWDSVMSYSAPDPLLLPVDIVTPPIEWPGGEPSWWPNLAQTPPTPPIVTREGQYEGYERNMDDTGAGAPNFPEGHGFAIVILTTQALQLSGSAPVRRDRHTGAEMSSDNDEWPNNQAQGARLFYDLYFQRYLAPVPATPPPVPALPSYYAICSLPEREIRAFLEENGSEVPLKQLVWHLLQYWGSRIIAWYGVDEPELGVNTKLNTKDRQQYASPDKCKKLRDKIREWETLWRDENEIGFRNNPDKEKMLRPVITSISAGPAFNSSLQKPIAYRDSFDIFMFDQYPYRQFMWQLREDTYIPGDPPGAEKKYDLEFDLTNTDSAGLVQQRVQDALLNFADFSTKPGFGVNAGQAIATTG